MKHQWSDIYHRGIIFSTRDTLEHGLHDSWVYDSCVVRCADEGLFCSEY